MSEVAFQDCYPEPMAQCYGGLLASLVDCHATGTAAGAATRAAGDPITPETIRRFLTVGGRGICVQAPEHLVGSA